MIRQLVCLAGLFFFAFPVQASEDAIKVSFFFDEDGLDEKETTKAIFAYRLAFLRNLTKILGPQIIHPAYYKPGKLKAKVLLTGTWAVRLKLTNRLEGTAGNFLVVECSREDKASEVLEFQIPIDETVNAPNDAAKMAPIILKFFAEQLTKAKRGG
jgi:hypothetical protein